MKLDNKNLKVGEVVKFVPTRNGSAHPDVVAARYIGLIVQIQVGRVERRTTYGEYGVMFGERLLWSFARRLTRFSSAS